MSLHVLHEFMKLELSVSQSVSQCQS